MSLSRVHARNLSGSAISVYVLLSSRSNRDGRTTVGIRGIGATLGISKTTVVKAMKELKVYQLLVQRTGGVYQIRVPGVPQSDTQVYQKLYLKEESKEVFKERELIINPKWEQLRKKYQLEEKV